MQPLCGSAARGDDRPGSDLDLLVEMESGRSLLDLVGLGQDLEELLSRRVDVLTEAVCIRLFVLKSSPARGPSEAVKRLDCSKRNKRLNTIG